MENLGFFVLTVSALGSGVALLYCTGLMIICGNLGFSGYCGTAELEHTLIDREFSSLFYIEHFL